MLHQLENIQSKKDPKILKYWLTNEISSSINHVVIKIPATKNINPNIKKSKKN